MLQKFSRSIVLRITSMMISLILMVFISTFSSMYMSQISEFDGKTINLSGSLWMMSYRIFTQVAVMEQSPTPQNHLKVQQLIQHFDTLFRDPLLTKDFIRFKEVKLQQDYNNIEAQWQTVINQRYPMPQVTLNSSIFYLSWRTLWTQSTGWCMAIKNY